MSTIFYEAADHPVTAGTVLSAIAVTAAYWNDFSIDHLVMTQDAFFTEPWRLVTSALPHGGVVHLLFNLYWTWNFGKQLEQHLGILRTAGVFVLLASCSAAAEFAFFRGGIGLSGVGYGLFGMLWILGRRDPQFRGVVDERTTGLFVVWFFLCIALTAMGTWRIANVAHGAGAVIGYLLGASMRPRPNRVLHWRGALLGVTTGIVLLASVGREHVNLGGGLAHDFFREGFAAYEEEDYERAIDAYQSSLEHDAGDASAWKNLGLALNKADRLQEALIAFDRAIEVDPNDESSHVGRGACLAEQEEFSAALASYERALELSSEDPDLHGRRGWCLGKLGKFEEGLKALNRALELGPSTVWIQNTRAWSLGRLGRFEEALEAIEGALELEPENPKAGEIRRWILSELSRD